MAAGESRRFGGGVRKQFRQWAGRPLAEHAVRALAGEVAGIVVVLPSDSLAERAATAEGWPGVERVVAGGPQRSLSVLNGVRAADRDYVLVHDAARPFPSRALIRRVIEATRRHGAALPALPLTDTIKRREADGSVAETLDRRLLHGAQTPQGARRDWLLEALTDAESRGEQPTDESQALERAGRRVQLVDGEPGNVKITRPGDLPRPAALRVGQGYDVHRLAPGRPLVLGGVTFDHPTGLEGHSDADVLLHAVMDALLGAAALGDIGRHFPPDDERWRGADSRRLAERVAELLAEAGCRPVNIDATVVAERPKLGPHAPAMRETIAACFGLPPGSVSVKATTHERLGALGAEQGIACHAIALVETRNEDAW